MLNPETKLSVKSVAAISARISGLILAPLLTAGQWLQSNGATFDELAKTYISSFVWMFAVFFFLIAVVSWTRPNS